MGNVGKSVTNLKAMKIDADRMAQIYHEVIDKGHELVIIKVGEGFLQVQCKTDDCTEDGIWWDHWNFGDSYTARTRESIGDDSGK